MSIRRISSVKDVEVKKKTRKRHALNYVQAMLNKYFSYLLITESGWFSVVILSNQPQTLK